MSKINSQERSLLGIDQLSIRSIVIGSLGSVVITASSMYIALKMSALPWPTILVALLSMSVLKLIGKTTLNEVNITQTAMSAGAMVAGGLAFTLPGLWITGTWTMESITTENFLKVLAIAVAGSIIGSVASWLLRNRFIEKQQLPYPIGMAAAEAIKTGDEGGKKSIVLYISLGLSAIYTYFKDYVGNIPAVLFANGNFGIWNSPMAIGIGYIIGTLYTGVWFLGAIISYVLIIPLGPKLGLFADSAAATSFASTLGIGIMIGTGFGVLISMVYKWIKNTIQNRDKKNSQFSGNKTINDGKSSKAKLLALLFTLLTFVFTVASGLSIIPSILLIAGVYITSIMAATLTGQTGVNPMEVFGIIVLLGIRLFVNVNTLDAFIIAACVAIACGYSGDLFNDYKAGAMLGTNPKAQLISQVFGGIVGAVVATAALFALIKQYGGVGGETGLTAGQAFAVTSMVNGLGDPIVLTIGAVIGAVLFLLGVPAATLGLGIYLPFIISAAVFIGGIIRLVVDKVRPKSSDTGTIASSGLLGGEGITGVTIAIIKLFSGT